jgi:chromosomal replication initiator protein
MSDLWRRCLERLESELTAEELHTWLMPLQAREDDAGVQLFAPNPYTLDTVRDRYLPRIVVVLGQLAGRDCAVHLEVGSSAPRASRPARSRSICRSRPARSATPT